MKEKGTRDRGTASFAMLGVLIILLSIIATAHISHLERLNYEERLRGDLLTKMDNMGEEFLDSIDARLHTLGVEAAFMGNRAQAEPSGDLFADSSEEFLGSILGSERRDGSFSMTLLEHNVTMGIRTMEVDDTMPLGNDIRVDGPGESIRSNRSYCYGISGTLRVLVRDDRRGTELHKDREVDLTVDVPYPFIKERSASFTSTASGSQGHLGRMVEYMLTTVAQYRAFMGERDSEKILTNQDVELAVNLALILEIAYQFRYHDQNATRALSGNVSGDLVDLTVLIDHYIKTSRVDPGDLIALYHGYAYDNVTLGPDDVTPMNIPAIIEQALHVMWHEFVMKYLHYFGLIDIADAVLRGVKAITEFIDEGASAVTGFVGKLNPFSSDDDQEKHDRKNRETAKNWVRETFLAAGLMNTNIARTRYHAPFNMGDKEIVGYPTIDLDVGQVTFDITVRLTGDEYSWYSYNCHCSDRIYQGETGKLCNEILDHGVRCNAEEVLVKYNYTTYGIIAEFEPVPAFFVEWDILDDENNDLWLEFYKDYYSEGTDIEVNSISDAIGMIINHIVDTVYNHLKPELEGLSRLEIDPGDRSSLLREMNDVIITAIDIAFSEFRDNPDTIIGIIQDMLKGDDDDEDNINGLVTFLNDKYTNLLPNGYNVQTIQRTEELLFRPDSGFITFTVKEKETSGQKVDHHSDISLRGDETIPHTFMVHKALEKLDYFEMEGILEVGVRDALDELKRREVDPDEGLLVKALLHYRDGDTSAYGEYDSSALLVRSMRVGGNSDEGNFTIKPNPATINEHTVFFNSTICVDARNVSWSSDINGYLSNETSFSLPAGNLSQGTHRITLNWTDDHNRSHTENMSLEINPEPMAMIVWISDNRWERGEITFEQKHSGNLGKIIWDFGDGNETKSMDPLVYHTYERPGTYTVNLTVEDTAGAKRRATETILIDNRPYVESIEPKSDLPLATDTSFTITFSETVDPDSFTYTLEPVHTGGADDFSLEEEWFEDRWVDLIPRGFFQRNTTYYLNVTEVEDVDNGTYSPLLETYHYEFKTQGHGNMRDWYPNDGEVIPVDRDIVLVFDEAVGFGGVNTVNDLLRADRNYGWFASFSEDNKIITIEHDSFPYGTEMNITIILNALVALSDGSNISSSEDTTMRFRTVEDPTHPFIVSNSAVGNAHDMGTSGEIKIEFNMDMNSTSFEVLMFPDKILQLEWCGLRNLTITYDGLDQDTIYRMELRGNDTRDRPLISYPSDPLLSNTFYIRTVVTDELKILYCGPGDGMEKFLTNAPVIVMFNRPVDPSTLVYSISGNTDLDVKWCPHNMTAYIFYDGYEVDEEYRFVFERVEDGRDNSLIQTFEIRYNTSAGGDDIEGTWLERRIWSIIGGGLGKFGPSFFDLAESFVKAIVVGMMDSSRFSQLEYRVPLNVDQPFTYGDHGEMELRATLEPSFVSLEDGISIDSFGVHHTDITSFSSRPFETYFYVTVPNVPASVNVSRIGHGVVLQGEHHDIWWEEEFDIGFNLTVSVSTGWELEHVDYEDTNTFGGDILRFLNQIWGYLKDIVGYVIGAIQRILELFDSLVERVKEFGQEILLQLGDVIMFVRGQLQDLLPNVIKIISALDSIPGISGDGTISILGLTFILDTKTNHQATLPMQSGTFTRHMNLSLEGDLFGTYYSMNMNLLEDNVIVFGDLSVRDVVFQWVIDPFADPQSQVEDVENTGVYDAWFQCGAWVDGGNTEFNLKVPVISQSRDSKEMALSAIFPVDQIRIPLGPVVISGLDLGMEFAYDTSDLVSILAGLMHTAFRDTRDALKGTAIGINYVVEFVRTLVWNIINGFIAMAVDVIQELVFFFQAAVNEVEIKLYFAIAGGESVASFVNWVASAVKELLQGFVEMRPSLPNTLPPTSVMQNTTFGVEVGKEDAVVYFTADVPAMSAVVGRHMGEWELGFGVKVDDFNLVHGQLTGG